MDRKLLACIGLGLAGLVATGAAQNAQRALTIDTIYDPQARLDFNGAANANMTWLDAASWLEVRGGRAGTEWVRVDAATGQRSQLFDAARMQDALAAMPGLDRDDAVQAARSGDVTLDAPRTGALLTINDDLYHYSISSGRAVRLTSAAGEEEEATFSPDGRVVAFVRANNLYAVDVASQRERALTTDGTREILNGKLDWLYQEEIYGRGFFRGYWWSPDSSRVAFLQLDERPVPEYVVIDTIPTRPTPEVTHYPKAGDPNPKVRLGIAAVSGGAPQWTDAAAYAAVDHLVVDVSWTPDAGNVVYQVQDREQTWLDLNLAEAVSGRSRRVLRETTKAWVNVNGSPVWLGDGSFLWLSERSGYKHVYQYRTDGTQVRQVTNGPWDVVTLYGVDEPNGLIYFASNERAAIGTDLYRGRLTGSTPTRLSQAAGTHRAIFNPTFTQYVGVWSDVTTPTQVRLHRADGTQVRVLDANPVPALSQVRLSTPEFVRVPTRDGGVMDAMIIKPPDMVPGRRYPVFQHTYAGHGVAQVRNQWGGSAYMFHQMLAQNGVVVWILDNRSASSKGMEAQWAVYGRLGELELRDLEDGVSWLEQQPYIDASRVVMSGWSYGGFMTSYALTHSTRWAGGIAGGSVTDWRNYDTIWTERYMKTPQNNPDGYRRTAPRYAADRLSGRLLLIHGAIDDNVHAQNTDQFVYELQRAGKPFELMMYPRQRHGVTDPRLVKHLRQTMFDFTLRTVGAARPAGAAASR